MHVTATELKNRLGPVSGNRSVRTRHRLSRQAGRFIKTLPPEQYKQVVSAMPALLSNPEPHDSRV